MVGNDIHETHQLLINLLSINLFPTQSWFIIPIGKLSLVTDRVLILLSDASLADGDAVESLSDSSSGSTSSVDDGCIASKEVNNGGKGRNIA